MKIYSITSEQIIASGVILICIHEVGHYKDYTFLTPGVQ